MKRTMWTPDLEDPGTFLAVEIETPDTKKMWEILVPTVWQESGIPIKTKHHKVWDKKVLEVAEGLTIMHPTIGYWTYDDKVFQDRMIPVRIIATEPEMDKILDLTLQHYWDEIAILCYEIPTTIKIRKRGDK